MINMTVATKILFSWLIGVIALLIAKYVHPSWGLNQLLIFGAIVFIITLILALILAH